VESKKKKGLQNDTFVKVGFFSRHLRATLLLREATITSLFLFSHLLLSFSLPRGWVVCLTSLYCPVSIVLVMDKPALKDVATYRDSKGMVEHLQTTLGSSNVFMSNVAGSAGWGFLISSALTYHRYRHLLSSGTIEKIVSTAKAAAAKENVAAGRHMSDFGPGKKFDQKAYERLTLKKKLSNTWFGSFMVIFPGGHYMNHRNELRRKQAVNQAKVEELKKIGVVEATKENIEGGKGKCADGGDLLNEYRFVPEWDGKTEDVKRKSLWEK